MDKTAICLTFVIGIFLIIFSIVCYIDGIGDDILSGVMLGTGIVWVFDGISRILNRRKREA